MATMQKTTIQIQGELKTLKGKISGQTTKIPYATMHKKGKWWSNPYFWTHGVGRHDGETCFIKADGHKEKAASLNNTHGSKRVIPEGALHEGSNTVHNIKSF